MPERPVDRFGKMAIEARDRTREATIRQVHSLRDGKIPMDMSTFIDMAYYSLREAENEILRALGAVAKEMPEADDWDKIAEQANYLLDEIYEQLMQDGKREWRSVDIVDHNHERFNKVKVSLRSKVGSFVEGEKKSLREARKRRRRDLQLLFLGAVVGALCGQAVSLLVSIFTR